MKKTQQSFEADVRGLKNEANDLHLAKQTKHYNFGKDPHRSSGNLGVRKSLHRACSDLLRKHLSNWIPLNCTLQFCTLSNLDGGGGICCYDLQRYQWSEPLNLVSLITGMFGVDAVSDNKKEKWNKVLTRYLIDELTCLLACSSDANSDCYCDIKRILMKETQKSFEEDVRGVKNEANDLHLAKQTKHYTFGKDPQRSSGNLGVRKSLHRACSDLIRKHLLNWIPLNCTLQFCTLSNVENNGGICCYDLQRYQWSEPLNLVSLITGMFGVDAVSDNKKEKWNKVLTRYLIDERTSNCKLQVVVNDEYTNEYYLKRVKQDRVSKSMDIAQNQYRMSYAPRILVEVGNEILMSISCPDNFVGLGFWNLVKWRHAADNNEDPKSKKNDDDDSQKLHAMLHICEDLEVMKKVEIAFGTTVNSSLQSVKINCINLKEDKDFDCLTLYEMATQPNASNTTSNTEHTDSIPKRQRSPDNDDDLPATKLQKK
eukprot:CAMPEP_0202728604 /NCGR_PEP_ID=MMETSP1385-20130828/185710_1 /ASSEMBLY_ACC=CAM_ASM_000861 /TAXON_ID=933848 /ORGANISM="Elphidium margaritaceum" /LENGTH=483 /DNA_ID=CAMNT_0049394855 /DNA_START=52 /DNA_END=1503 /DNA_ORIENTATION=-